MKYDFTSIVSRKGVGASKWEQMYKWAPNVSDGVVPLSVADMEFVTMPEIVEGLKKFLDTAVLGYTEAYPTFLESVQKWCEKRYKYKIEKDWIVNVPGIVNAVFAAVSAFTNVGDGVVVFRPVYYPFFAAIERNNRKLVNCPLLEKDGYYSIDFDKFDKLTQDQNVKMLILCNPHNPVGRVWKRDELVKIAKIAIKNNITVVSDEIHCDLIMPGNNHTTMAVAYSEISDRLITCFAPSKTFNLAGLATSNIIVPNKNLRDKYKDTLITMRSTSVNIMGYKACEIAYNKGEEWLSQLITVLDKNQKTVKMFFETNFPKIKAPLIEGTYLQWIDFRGLGYSNEDLEKFMHTKAEFFTDEGYVFGPEGSGYERVNLAAPTSVIENALNRLGEALRTIYK